MSKLWDEQNVPLLDVDRVKKVENDGIDMLVEERPRTESMISSAFSKNGEDVKPKKKVL
jgi:hypothetical protein